MTFNVMVRKFDTMYIYIYILYIRSRIKRYCHTYMNNSIHVGSDIDIYT